MPLIYCVHIVFQGRRVWLVAALHTACCYTVPSQPTCVTKCYKELVVVLVLNPDSTVVKVMFWVQILECVFP